MADVALTPEGELNSPPLPKPDEDEDDDDEPPPPPLTTPPPPLDTPPLETLPPVAFPAPPPPVFPAPPADDPPSLGLCANAGAAASVKPAKTIPSLRLRTFIKALPPRGGSGSTPPILQQICHR